MLKGIYFLLLLAASAEDYRTHTVNSKLVFSVWILGLIQMVLVKENRWVTLALTCLCFVLLLLVYLLVRQMEKHQRAGFSFGGADVRLIPAMMLVQGWDVALSGVFSGLFLATLHYLTAGRHKKELPLVPWMTAGCFLVEIIYLFFSESVL